MAEEFDPNAFRQQVAQGAGQVPAPIPAPVSAPVAPQHPVLMQGQPQPYVPQQAPLPQAAPQQYVPQQPTQFQAPQYQGQQQVQQHGQPQGQPQAYQPPQAQPQFRPQMQPAYDPAQHMPPHNMQGQQMPQEVQQPKAKTSLFKRKKLKAAAAQMTPQLDGARDMMPDVNKSGLSRLIPFLGGLAVGVLGTLVAIMLFSGNEPQRANIAMTGPQAETATDMPTGQMALTDEMLMENAGGKP